MTKEMMNTKDVADYLNINEKQVYKLIKEADIPATRVTGKWTFPKRLIDEWIIKSAEEHAGIREESHKVENHVVVMGSNDFSMEILSHELTAKYPQFSMSVSNVGSMGGLVALGQGICHAASCHLLDPETGVYNVPVLSRYLPDLEVIVINMVYRDLGLIVKQNNPKNISRIENLVQKDISFINRQEGSGTRTFFDSELTRLGITGDQIPGYDNQVNTHTDIAIAVLSGKADAGIGIMSAAKMLGLEFIYLTKERYDLLIPTENLSAEPVKAFLHVIRSQDFKKKIKQMAGYDTKDTGNIMNKN